MDKKKRIQLDEKGFRVGTAAEFLDLTPEEEIILRPAETIRKGWESSFEKMSEQGDDGLLDQEEIERPSDWDEAEWTW